MAKRSLLATAVAAIKAGVSRSAVAKLVTTTGAGSARTAAAELLAAAKKKKRKVEPAKEPEPELDPVDLEDEMEEIPDADSDEEIDLPEVDEAVPEKAPPKKKPKYKFADMAQAELARNAAKIYEAGAMAAGSTVTVAADQVERGPRSMSVAEFTGKASAPTTRLEPSPQRTSTKAALAELRRQEECVRLNFPRKG